MKTKKSNNLYRKARPGWDAKVVNRSGLAKPGGAKKRKGRKAYKLKMGEILQFSLEGKFLREYSSIIEAGEDLRIDHKAISRCLDGAQKTGGDFQWRYKIDPNFDEGIFDILPVKEHRILKLHAVVQYDLEGKFVKEYASLKEAAEICGIPVALILLCIRGQQQSTRKYQWRLKKDVIKDGKIMDIVPVKKQPELAVCKFDMDGKFIREYSSMGEAARDERISRGAIFLRLKRKKSGVYQWRFKVEVEKDGKIIDIGPLEKRRYKHKINPKYNYPVCQFGLDGTFIQVYPSIFAAANITGIPGYSIFLCASKKFKKRDDYLWRFKKDVVKKGGTIKNIDISPAIPLDISRYSRPVCQFEKNGKFIREYPSILDAAHKTNAYKVSIYMCTQKKQETTAGFQWRLKEEVVKNDGKIRDIEPVRTLRTILPHFLPAVCQFEENGKFIREYPSILVAAHKTNAYKRSIYMCTQKKMKITAGFQWRLKEEVVKDDGKIRDIEPARTILPHFLPAVCQFGLDGKFIREYPSILEAEEKTGINRYIIFLCASKKYKMVQGFQWRYKDDPEFKNGITDIAPYERKKYRGGKGRKKKE
jgi:L-rhamnose mutarotase